MRHKSDEIPPPLTPDENIKVYLALGARYRRLPDSDYWAWDTGWDSLRLLRELKKQGISNLTMSRLGNIRLEHYGKTRDATGGHGNGKKKGEAGMPPAWVDAVDKELELLVKGFDAITKKHKTDMQAIAKDFGDLQGHLEGIVNAQNITAQNLMKLQATHGDWSKAVSNRLASIGNPGKVLTEHTEAIQALRQRIEALEGAYTAPKIEEAIDAAYRAPAVQEPHTEPGADLNGAKED